MTWSDVDFHKRFIKIDHQLIYELDEKRMRDEMDKLDAVRNVSKDIGNDNNGKAFKVS